MSITQIRKRYLWRMTVSFMAAIVAAFMVNLVIDPYSTFRLFDVKGLNRVKPNPDHDIETIKAHALRNASPDALILGNSRAEVGFDPTLPDWKAAGYNSVYNAAIRGSSLSTAWNLLRKAAQQHPPKLVLMGLDFFDFPIAPNKQVNPARTTDETWLDDVRWILRATVTTQALLDSITTIRRQYQANPEQLTDLGQTPLRNYLDIARIEGYWPLFNQRAVENAKSHSRKSNNLFLQGTQSSPEFEDVRQIVRWTVQNNADLRLVIYPYHAQLLVMIDELGLWPLFEEWKRQILRIVDEETSSANARRQVALIDFSGFSVYAQEPIPPKGDKKSATQWYWEAGHFKAELGNIILGQVISAPTPNNSADFGVALNSQNIGRHLNLLRANKDAFRAGNGDMVSEVSSMIKETKETNSTQARRP